ncbi:hypothetical protein A1O1_07039 [Capronia coronata CBS 617.96]|uniref:U3 small nucleolar RNA-associated protein 10 n=1 Tax=Capronia coronata CBS 617.96 TaxID=1182541 RepID=W9Y2H1_9EURO|nr:uncharacterized protein A1O1_07039 [Capronia coronata CBS 617.96]EXJ83416.1 hypothetical protein A1O1_07039 [Capronia coronata CBS 617.96]
MTSAFAAQLRTIAANSTNELDLRARREAHAESLIFDRVIAVKQDWETIYQICVEGFQELCLLDTRLREFEHNLYSPQSKDQDREQMSKSQNEALGLVLERCLSLLGSKVLLRPGIRAVEWLVRRFRVHVYDTGALLATFLPYHEAPVFRNVLSIIPANKITNEWKFLGPYHKIAANVPRHAVVYTAVHNDAFFSFLNNHTIRVCQDGADHPQLMRFWGSVVIEAISGRLNQVKSGRKEVQRQRLEDALLKILPVLSEGLEIHDCHEMTLTCFTIALVLASNSDLEDRVIDSITRDVAPFLTNSAIDTPTALACLCVLDSKKSERKVTRDVLEVLLKIRHLDAHLLELRGKVPVDGFCESLVNSALAGLKESNISSRFAFVEMLFDMSPKLVEPATTSRCLAALLRRLPKATAARPLESAIRERIIRILQRLNDTPTFSSALSHAVTLAGMASADVESLIEGTIEAVEGPKLLEPAPMDIDKVGGLSESDDDSIDSMLAALPSEPTESSFLTHKRDPLFDQLLQVFGLCYRKESAMKKFEGLTVWRQQIDKPSDLLTSFLLRLACSASSYSQRSAALHFLSKLLERGSRQDTQLLIPYLALLLAEPAQSIRRAASACLLTVQKCIDKSLDGGNDHEKDQDTLYDAVAMTNVKRVPSSQAKKLLTQIFLPHLEECILDASHIRRVLENAIDSQSRSSSVGSKVVNVELKKSLKQDLFELLTGCALGNPLLKVQSGVVDLLIGVPKVGSTSTSKVLQPLLRQWASLGEDDAASSAASEGFSVAQIDSTLVRLINAHDKEGVQHVLETLDREKSTLRPDLVRAIFERIATIWKDIRHDSQITAATMLFDMSFSDNEAIAAGSQQVLRSATLATDVLATLLDHACSGLAQMQIEVPPKKRRRVSHGRESIPEDMVVQLDVADSRLSLALELVEDSKPETHPQLLGSLFEMLINLRRLKEKSTAESPYLLTLCLGSILAIVDKAREARKPNIDMSSIRADLVTDCVRSTENPQVQATALLLLASLASIAPDRILHTVMPIFTFMGTGILSRDDERSVYVINQAIDQIIPPLVGTLKRQDANNLVHATSSLLSSFVTAFDHIPQHRRVAFYTRLLDRLGANDFAFAIIALLATRRPQEDTSSFLSVLTAGLPATSQLLTHRKILALTRDIFSNRPHNAEPLLDITKSTKADKKEHAAVVLLETASKLLETKGLKAQVKKLRKVDETDAEAFWAEYKICLQDVLVMLKNQRGHQSSLASSTRKCLTALLGLPSLAELLRIMPTLLGEMEHVEDQELPPLALRILAAQFQHNPAKDSKTQTEAMNFLPTVESIIRTTSDETFRQAAIAALDRIVEVYGRKSPETILSASTTLIGGDHGLSSKDSRTQIMSLLCVASMMEVLKEAAVPIVPQAMPKVLGLLKQSLGEDSRNEELHNASFTLISSFLSHVPFMVSDENVIEILGLSYYSCLADMDASSKESRMETLTLLAQKVDLNTIATSLTEAWKAVSANNDVDVRAVTEYLDLLSQAIEHNSKSNVVRAAETISTFMLQILDLRHLSLTLPSGTSGPETKMSLEDIDAIESKLHAVSITFIYKLNDSAFRPLFETWVDWALKAPDLAASGVEYTDAAKTARQTSLFNLGRHFFATLKSIVTSYASYILDAANEVLRRMVESNKPGHRTGSGNGSGAGTGSTPTTTTIPDETLTLYKSTLSLLSTAMLHDADTFFAAPSHFSPLSSLLISQLTLASSSKSSKMKPIRLAVFSHVIPTIVALATATVDTPAHHHALNHGLCQLRHNPSAGVRLAAIRTHLALTQAEDVGEEWVNNVVVGTSTEGVGGSGETMVYVNESLEDDDEEVENDVRKWVRLVREMVGEDVFEV